jgi:hypothetical protein
MTLKTNTNMNLKKLLTIMKESGYLEACHVEDRREVIQKVIL